VFNEITRRAIQEAFAEPADVDTDRVNAQQARRFLDRVVGFELSPLALGQGGPRLSAGRVQSVAVRLIVEREREIRAFEPEEYWEAFADLMREGASDAHRFQVVRDDGKNFRPGNAETAHEAMDAAASASSSRSSTAKTSQPAHDPVHRFITSTLQQAASTRLGFSVKKTMTLAQRLYEAGHITYMRTDSTNLSGEALGSVRGFIGKEYGDRICRRSPTSTASKADAQEAHEAIRPTERQPAANCAERCWKRMRCGCTT
jgi:DNA topoisomerase I